MADWHEILSTIPIFSFLGRADIDAVTELFIEEVQQKGDVICRQGDEGDKFYIVLDGELEVLAGERVAAVLKRGDFFGEMALLQGGKRTATVQATRRVRLVSLDRFSFNSLFLKNPKALEYFTRVLCKRLAATSSGEVARGSNLTIAVGSRPGLKGKSIVASALAGILHDLTGSDVLLISVKPSEAGAEGAVAALLSDAPPDGTDTYSSLLRQDSDGVMMLDIPARVDRTAAFYSERASNLISKLSDRFPFMVFDLASEPVSLFDAVPKFSDIFVEIVDAPPAVASKQAASSNGQPASGPKRYHVINLSNPKSRPISINHCEPFVLPRDAALASANTTSFVRNNSHAPASLPLHRLARKVLGATVGIALGGGAAFGIAHLGVLKVLEKNGIFIDLLAGCSQGSIIGVGYAAGVGNEEMIDIALGLGKKANSLLAVDLTLTKPGILAGNRFVNIFAPLLGNKTTFEDLVMPCRTVATDIQSGERVAIGTGSLAAAFRASASVPMVFAPVKRGERVLVDGGVTDPVPAEVVNGMGADLCIAVNVVPPLKLGVENVLSRSIRNMSRFNPMSWIEDSQGLPNMFDIIMNSMQILQYELGNFKAISADVLINPELSDFTWVEYYRSAELIQRGVDAAERALPAIQRAVRQKLAPWQKRAS